MTCRKDANISNVSGIGERQSERDRREEWERLKKSTLHPCLRRSATSQKGKKKCVVKSSFCLSNLNFLLNNVAKMYGGLLMKRYNTKKKVGSNSLLIFFANMPSNCI
jgi:hypothetical protein